MSAVAFTRYPKGKGRRPSSDVPGRQECSISIRAVILGLLGAALICGATFFNDMVMRGTFLVGNYLPVSVFGGLLLFLLLVNPLLRLAAARFALSGRELAVILALTLCACYIPGRGLMHQFTTLLMLPHHYERTDPSWQGEPARFTPESVRDWGRFQVALTSMVEAHPEGVAGVDSLAQRVWNALPTALRARAWDGGVITARLEDDPALQALALEGLNAILAERRFADPAQVRELKPPRYVLNLLERGPEVLDTARLADLNRGILESLFRSFPDDVFVSRQAAVLEHVPPRMLADADRNSTVALDGFVNSLAVGDKAISFSAVPWAAWKRTLGFWLPLIFAMCVASIGLALVLHRQWADHENLPYPVVEFARALLPAEGEGRSSIFGSRLFWGGLGFVFVWHMNNYAYVWWPDYLIRIQTRLNFYPLLELFPVYRRAQVAVYQIFRPQIYFTVIGFAYFLATDVSLSLGIAPYVFGLATGLLTGYGVFMGVQFLQPTSNTFLYAGAYCSMFLVLMYTGRHYYLSVFRRGLGLPTRDAVEPAAVWGARAFVVATAAFVVQLTVIGLEWYFALFYAMVMFAVFVVLSRLLHEAGVFFVHSYFFPCALLWGFLGPSTVGPDSLLIMGMLSAVLLIDPRETLMPYVMTGLRLVDRTGDRVGKTAGWGVAALVVGFMIAVPATLYLQYQHGAIRTGDGWTYSSVPRFPFTASVGVRSRLAAQGMVGAAAQVEGLARLGAMIPIKPCLIAFAVTFLLVLLFTSLRHHLPWWPFHPLLFLVLGTWQSCTLGFSFLLGWFVKACVSKYGGADMYQKLKPLMIGLIAGEMLSGVVPMLIGAVYYWVTGKPPPPFSVTYT